MIAIDTETYYDKKCSVLTLGAEAYTRHPDYYCYMVSIWGEGISFVGRPEDAPWDKINGTLWVAHNAQFDQWVIKRMIDSGQIPASAPSRWADTSAIPAYLQVKRSLDSSAKILLNESVTKTVRTAMEGKHFKDLTPEESKALHEYALADARLCHNLYRDWGDKLSEDEWALAEMTVDQGNYGVQLDVRLLEDQLASVHGFHHELINAIPWAQEKAPTSVLELKKQVRKDQIPDMPDTTAAKDSAWGEWSEKWGEHYPYIKAFCNLRRCNKHVSTLENLNRRMDPEGIYHFSLKFCGSRLTGRWSGDGGMNMQNLTKEEIFGARIRDLVIPRAGHKLIISDLSQIEPRCLAALAGDWDFLDYVKKGADVYEAHARSTMGYTDPRPLKEVDPETRAVAKARTLGLGYGCGAVRYQEFAKQYGLELSEVDATVAVALYRRQNPKIVNLWNRLGNGFAKKIGKTFTVELPTGRKLNWFDIAMESWHTKTNEHRKGLRATTERGSGGREPFWGSKLCENVTQALARDVFASALVRIHKAGIRILWTVHDEVICEVPEDRVEEALEFINREMTRPHPTMPDLPLAVDSHVAERYDK